MGKLHIGHAIKDELKRQGKDQQWFSNELGKSRSATYILFNRQSIDTDELCRICQILGVDFFKMLSESLDIRD